MGIIISTLFGCACKKDECEMWDVNVMMAAGCGLGELFFTRSCPSAFYQVPTECTTY